MAGVAEMMEVMKRMLESLEAERREREAMAKIAENKVPKPVITERVETASSLDTFSDGSPAEAEEWLKRFELAKQVGDWTECKTKAVLFQKLVGAAAYWHCDHGADLAFDGWKDEFRKAFIPGQTKEELVTLLMSSRQTKGENVNLFARRTEHLAKKLEWDLTSTKMVILRGLRPEYAFMFHTVRGRRHENVTELVLDIEETMRCEHARGVGVVKFDEKRKDRKDISCFSCGKKGHKVADCWFKQAGGGDSQSTSKPGSPQKEAEKTRGQDQKATERARGLAMDSGVRPRYGPRAEGEVLNRPPRTCFECGSTEHLIKDCPPGIGSIEKSPSREEATVEEKFVDPAVKHVLVNGQEWTARVDTEAAVSSISQRAADQLGLNPDANLVQRVRGVGGEPFETLGEARVQLEVDELSLPEVTLTVLPMKAMIGDDILLGKVCWRKSWWQSSAKGNRGLSESTTRSMSCGKFSRRKRSQFS